MTATAPQICDDDYGPPLLLASCLRKTLFRLIDPIIIVTFGEQGHANFNLSSKFVPSADGPAAATATPAGAAAADAAAPGSSARKWMSARAEAAEACPAAAATQIGDLSCCHCWASLSARHTGTIVTIVPGRRPGERSRWRPLQTARRQSIGCQRRSSCTR